MRNSNEELRVLINNLRKQQLILNHIVNIYGKEWLSVDEAAKIGPFERTTIFAMIKEGKFESKKLRNKRLIKLSSYMSYLNA
jgi:excisionase family DNA binding protein